MQFFLSKSSAHKGILNRLDARAKLLWMIVLAFLAVALREPYLLLILFISTWPFWLLLKPDKDKLKKVLMVFASLTLSFMISQALFYYWAKAPWLVLIPEDCPLIGRITGGVYIYKEGIIHGAVQSLRLLSTMGAALIVAGSTHPSEFILALVKLVEFRVGKKTVTVGLPYEIAFMVTTGLNFIPFLVQNITVTMTALKVRGVSWQGGLINKLKTFRYLFFPVMVGILRNSRQMAVAADLRAFRALPDRTFIRELRLGRPDYYFLFYVFTLSIGAIWCQEIFFS
ncbi:MAG: energy-coupling factor transporter transmembrane protein EcfT [Firmicutes bacterium HGW-Firmicutes-8]|nr:MAG: energy-coupling factor transporter transmembrane protein EcfT [Firmicutes bacterium HGW-Firmicutes-8]